MRSPTPPACTPIPRSCATRSCHPSTAIWRGLPPLLIHVSGSEILRDDAVRFATRARAAGVEVTLEVVDGMPHVWHLFAGMLAEADDALVELAVWLETFLR